MNVGCSRSSPTHPRSSRVRSTEVAREIPQAGLRPILVAQERSLWDDRPADAEVGIAPQQTHVALWIIVGVDLVLHQRVVRQRAKAVRNPPRHQRLGAICSGKLRPRRGGRMSASQTAGRRARRKLRHGEPKQAWSARTAETENAIRGPCRSARRATDCLGGNRIAPHALQAPSCCTARQKNRAHRQSAWGLKRRPEAPTL